MHLACISANKEGTRHKRPLRALVSIEHLSALHHAIILLDPFHAAVFAIALCTFFGCPHLGKTTMTVDAAFNEQYHVTHSVKCVILAGSYHYVLTLSPVLSFISYMMALALQASAFLGQKLPRNLVPLLSSQHEMACLYAWLWL